MADIFFLGVAVEFSIVGNRSEEPIVEGTTDEVWTVKPSTLNLRILIIGMVAGCGWRNSPDDDDGVSVWSQKLGRGGTEHDLDERSS